jgi:hypothetical protein
MDRSNRENSERQPRKDVEFGERFVTESAHMQTLASRLQPTGRRRRGAARAASLIQVMAGAMR